MKTACAISRVVCAVLLAASIGCQRTDSDDKPVADTSADRLSVYEPYMPARVEITPLTGFVIPDGAQKPSRIQVYVSVLDSFDCQIKSPGTFRFEMYERAERSSEPRGERIVLWPDADLTEAVENNNYWRDFLGAYEFNLNFEPQTNRRYILDVTLLCPMGRRLSDDFELEYAK